MVVSPLTDEAMYFEIVILLVSGVLLALIFRRHLQKRNALTLLLFVIFLNMVIGIFFIMLAKVYLLYIIGEYPSQADPWYWFITRVMDYRFGFMFIAVSILFSQVFRTKVFDETPTKLINYILYIYGIFIIAWAMFVFEFKYIPFNVVMFAILLGYLLLVFIPFSLKSFRSGRSPLVDVKYRKAFQYLGLMGVSFIGVLGFNAVDQILHFFNNEITYSVFYFLGWISHLAGMLFAYFGFLRPKGQ